jgi:hypothetical protein
MLGNLCTLSLAKYRTGLAKRSEPALRDTTFGVPDIITGQMDVLPGAIDPLLPIFYAPEVHHAVADTATFNLPPGMTRS